MLKSLENNGNKNNLNNFKQDMGVAVTEKTNDEETQQLFSKDLSLDDTKYRQSYEDIK